MSFAKLSDWVSVSILEIAAPKKYALNCGPFGSKLVSKDYSIDGVPVIRGTNLSGDSFFSFKDFVFVSEEKADSLLPNNAHPGDVIFTQRGTLGQIGIIPKKCNYKRFVVSQSQMKLTVDENKANPFFVYYHFRSPKTIQDIHNRAISSGVPHINLNTLRSFEINLPPLPTQNKIASILSAYDDLIENNTRRIKILETMAQTLYQEWFVKFRFPGHEQVKIVESELGLIPEGWEVKKVTDAVLVNPKTQIPKQGQKPFVPMGSLSTDSMLINDIESRTGNSGAKFKNHDTLLARITPSLENGKTGYVQFLPSDDSVARGSTEFIVLRSKTLCSEYVYLLARSDDFRENAIKSMTGSSGRQRVQVGCFDSFFIAHPDNKTIQKFSEIVSPLFREIYVLSEKNTNLRKTRDLLLPKLISGQIDVENLDIDTGELAA